MLNDDDGCAVVQQCLKNTQQHPHIQRMQTNGRLIEHKNGILLRFADLAGQLEPLCFSAGKARRFLSQRQVAKAKLLEYLQPLTDNFHLLTEVDRGVNIHIHQFRQGNACPVLVGELYLIGHSCIAGTAAVRAGNADIRQKLNIQTDDARSVAAGAAQGAGVVGKVARFIALFPGVGRFGIQLAQLVVNACIGRNGRADVDADGRGVNELNVRDSFSVY